MIQCERLIILLFIVFAESDFRVNGGAVPVNHGNNGSEISPFNEKNVFENSEERNLTQEIFQELNILSRRKQREIFSNLENQREHLNTSSGSLLLSESDKLSPLNVEELRNIQKTIKTPNSTLPAIRNKRTLNFLLSMVAKAMGYTLTPSNPDAEWIPKQRPQQPPAPPCAPPPSCRPSSPPPCAMPPSLPPCGGSAMQPPMQPPTIPPNQINPNTISYPYRPSRTIPLFNFAPLPQGVRVPYPPLLQPPAQRQGCGSAQPPPCSPPAPAPPPCGATPAPPPPCGTTPAPAPPPCGKAPPPSPPPCGTTPAPPPPSCSTPAPPPPPCGTTPAPSPPPCSTPAPPPPPCGTTPAPSPPPCSTPAPPPPPCTTPAPPPPPCSPPTQPPPPCAPPPKQPPCAPPASTPAPCTTPAPPPPPCGTTPMPPPPPCAPPAPKNPPCGPPASPPPPPPPQNPPNPKKGSILLEYDDPVRIQIFSNEKKYLPASKNIFKAFEDGFEEKVHSYFFPSHEDSKKKNEDIEEEEEHQEKQTEAEEEEEEETGLAAAEEEDENHQEQEKNEQAKNEEEEDESETNLSVVKKPIDVDSEKNHRRRKVSIKNEKIKQKETNVDSLTSEKTLKMKKPKRKKWVRIVKKQRRKTKSDSSPQDSFHIFTSDNFPEGSSNSPAVFGRSTSHQTYPSYYSEETPEYTDYGSESAESYKQVQPQKVVINDQDIKSPEVLRYDGSINPYLSYTDDVRRKELEDAVEKYVEHYVEKQLGAELIKNTGIPKTTVFEFTPKKGGPKIQTITTTVAKTTHTKNPTYFKPQTRPESQKYGYSSPRGTVRFTQSNSYENDSKQHADLSSHEAFHGIS